MILVRVGHKNMADCPTIDCLKQCAKMNVTPWPRINNGKFIMSNNIGARACMGKRARIWRNQPRNQRGELLKYPGRDVLSGLDCQISVSGKSCT